MQKDNLNKNWAGDFKPNLPANNSEPKSKFYTTEKQPNKTAVSIAIEFENGNVIYMPYAYLTKVEFNPSEGITIEWGATMVKIEGRNLRKLADLIGIHRVNYVKENIGQLNSGKQDELFIEKITKQLSF